MAYSIKQWVAGGRLALVFMAMQRGVLQNFRQRRISSCRGNAVYVVNGRDDVMMLVNRKQRQMMVTP